MKNKFSFARGFTLIELLVVISIISLLSSIVYSSLDSARRSSRDVQRVSQIQQLDKAIRMRFFNEGIYPRNDGYRNIWSWRLGHSHHFPDNVQSYLVDTGYLSQSFLDDPLRNEDGSGLDYCSGKDICGIRVVADYSPTNRCDDGSGNRVTCNCSNDVPVTDLEYAIFFSMEDNDVNHPLKVPRNYTAERSFCLPGPLKP